MWVKSNGLEHSDSWLDAVWHFYRASYASTVYAVIVCPSVCHKSGVLQRWLNLGSHNQCHTIAQGL